jgi:hypothetical protein
MGKLNGIELKRARLVPSSVFASPDAVVKSAELSRAEKIQILRRWEFDCRRSSSGEQGACGDFPDMLGQVQEALALLGGAPPLRASATEGLPPRREPTTGRLPGRPLVPARA